MDINIVTKAITDYIKNQWYSDIDWDIIIDNNGGDNYIVTLSHTLTGYNISDSTIECIFTFDDVQDATEEMAEEYDNNNYIYLSAFVDVTDAIVPQVNLIDTDDFYSFKETIDKFYTFLRRDVYSDLPANPKERFYFFGYND